MSQDIFALAERKLEWLDQRQRVLANNVANADTPEYKSRDMASFQSFLGHTIAPVRTNPMHLAGLQTASQKAGTAGERAPDGNAVNMQAELTKIAQTETDQAAVGNLWKTYMGMFTTALGQNG